MFRRSTQPRTVLIVDHEEEGSRLLSIDDSGISETPLSDMDSIADEVASRKPDLILVNPGALALAGDSLVQELNRLGHFEQSYSWEPAPGEMPN